MAFSNTYTTLPGSASSNREDLTDILSILAPEETPILSSGSRVKATNVLFEWTLDKLDDPSATGVVEGADVSTFTDAFGSRERTSNFVQKFRRDYMVSDLQEATDSVGPAKLAQAEAKSIRELKRDIELALAGTQDKQLGSGSNAYLTAGLGAFVDDNPASGLVPAGFETPSSSVFTGTSSAPFTEAAFNDLISSIYRQTGNVDSLVLIADTGLRRVISDFARIGGSAVENVRSVTYDGGSSTIKLSVELYQSDHGIVSIINGNPACMPASTGTTTTAFGYLVNPEYYGIHELIPMGSTRLPNQGGGERGYVDCVLGLGIYHPQAHGKIEAID
jgi:hypothetical protein